MDTPSLRVAPLGKAPTGIRGLDEITGGGLPRGRPTLVCGAAGCGKTLLAMEFLLHGAEQFGEPGVFMAFEETPEELATNVHSLGVDLARLVASKKLALDHVQISRTQFDETGDYDLEGLFVRLALAIDRIGAKRVVLDTIETLFGAVPNQSLLRSELQRLFHWLKDKGVTAVITGERGTHTLTRYGVEEYVSDCVIVLDHRVVEQMSTRRLRVLKYRGSLHGTNEYPFLIDKRGISVLPVTSAALDHEASGERISSGIPALDEMLGGAGFYRGSTVMISGTAGCGKTSVAATFAAAACARGERCLVFLFEESPRQWLRNMRSIGLDLAPYEAQGLLRFYAARPSLHGLEMHLAVMVSMISELGPQAVVVDPVSAFDTIGALPDVKAMLIRLVDLLKVRGCTALMTALTHAGQALEATTQQISSVVDCWLLLRDIECDGERNRGMYILKARGTAHSNQIREFALSDHGITLRDVYVGQGAVLTGSARLMQEARDRAANLLAAEELERQQLALRRKRVALESRIAALRAEFEADEAEALRAIGLGTAREARLRDERDRLRAKRSHAAGDHPEGGT